MEHPVRAATCMANLVLVGQPLSDEEQRAADDELKAANKAARSQGLRSTSSGAAYIQAYGPVRPLILPLLAPQTSRHVPLRLALRRAVRVQSDCERLGGVLSLKPCEA